MRLARSSATEVVAAERAREALSSRGVVQAPSIRASSHQLAMPLLHHIAQEPAAELAAGESPGLLLLLHGSGDNEHGLLPLGSSIAPPNFRVVSLRAPLPMGWGPGSFVWFEGMSRAPEPEALASTIGKSCDALFEFILAAPDLLGTDPRKVMLVGFSQGATMVWTALLSRWPRERFISAAVPISGRLMPELLQPGTALNKRLALPAQTERLPLFASHGACDSITPVEIGRANRDLYVEFSRGGPEGNGAGVGLLETDARPPFYNEYEHDEHEISAQCQADVAKFLARWG